MSCEVPTSLLCKNIFWLLEFELYINFSNLVQQVFLHYNLFKYFSKNSSKCLVMPGDAYNSTSCKNPVMFFENLSESTSSSFWSNLVICTATPFYFALVPLSFFLLIVLPTKPLSPGDWTHWSIFGACNDSLQFLPKTGFLKNLH